MKGLCSVHASDLTEPPVSGQERNGQQLSGEMPHASVCKLSPEPGAAEADVAESWNCRMSVAYTYMSKEHTGRRKKMHFSSV